MLGIPSSSAKEVSVGSGRSIQPVGVCIRTAGGSVQCTGLEKRRLSGSFESVDIGNAFGAFCAANTDGDIECWGGPLRRKEPMFAGEIPSEGSFDTVTVGRSHACGLREDDTVVCWGSNGEGQAEPPWSNGSSSGQ